MAGFGIELGQPLGLGGLIPADGLESTRRSTEPAGASFAETLKTALSQANATIQDGDAAALQLATGDATNLHEVVLATERANLALQFTMAIRNKLLDAYNELMRMPV